VAAIKDHSEESSLFFLVRSAYYRLIALLAETELLKNFTGFGLYDQAVIEHLRAFDDPYPYHRGQISELGYPVARVAFTQPQRKRGVTKSNFFTLYDLAMLGFTNHSKVPLRLAPSWVSPARCSRFWPARSTWSQAPVLAEFPIGQAPVVVGLFFSGIGAVAVHRRPR